MKTRYLTILLACVTALVLAISAPAALSDAYRRGGVYLFSHDFIADIPKRLTGPGRLRFVLQPLIAIILGIRGGLADARAARPVGLSALFNDRELRAQLVRSGLAHIAILVLMGILVDSVCQWLILGTSFPGAALVVGPVLIAAPYSVSRGLTNRIMRRLHPRKL